MEGYEFEGEIEEGSTTCGNEMPRVYHFENDAGIKIYAVWSPTECGEVYEYPLSNLTGFNTNYYYRLDVPSVTGIIEDATGLDVVEVSERPIFLVCDPFNPPPPPVECVDLLVAENVTCSSVNLTWEIPAGQVYDHYQIWFGPANEILDHNNPNLVTDNITIFETHLDGNRDEAFVGGLLNNTTYCFYVVPHVGNNSAGWCADPNPLYATTFGPDQGCDIQVLPRMLTEYADIDLINLFTGHSTSINLFDGQLNRDTMADCCTFLSATEPPGGDFSWDARGEFILVDLEQTFDIDVMYLYDGNGIGDITVEYWDGDPAINPTDPLAQGNWIPYIDHFIASRTNFWEAFANDIPPCTPIRYLKIYAMPVGARVAELVLCGKPMSSDPEITVVSTVCSPTVCPGGEVSIDYEICNVSCVPACALELEATVPIGLTPIGGDFQINSPHTAIIDDTEIGPLSCVTRNLLLQAIDNPTTFPQVLQVDMLTDGACILPITTSDNIFIIENNPITINKTHTENLNGELDFLITVCNTIPIQVDKIEVEDIVPPELIITNSNPLGQGFTNSQGQILTEIISLDPGLPNNPTCQTLRFFAKREGCWCDPVDNCATASIINSGCGVSQNCTSINGNVPSLNAVFTYTSQGDCRYTFIPEADEDPCIYHEWDFGDNSPISTEYMPPPHDYLIADTYTITHTVTNDCGDPPATFSVTITITDPVADFDADQNGCTVEFTSDDRDPELTHQWIFDDGNTSSAQDPTHTYQSTGTFIVKHTVENLCGRVVSYSELIVIDPPSADFTWIRNNCEICFVSNEDNVNHTWNFGDPNIPGGGTSIDQNPCWTYDKDTGPTFNVEHTVSSPCGDDELVKPVTIYVPTGEFNFEVVGCIVTFTVEENGDHQWVFGDHNDPSGGTSNDPNPTWTYSEPGTYTVTHTLETTCGVVEYELEIEITDCGNFTCPCLTEGSLNIDAGDVNAEILASNVLPNNIIDLQDYGGCMAIYGKLVFDKPDENFITYRIRNGEIKMQPGSEIIVRGSRVFIEDTRDFGGPGRENMGIHGCEKMWKGITIETGGSEEGTTSYLHFNDNIIQDAQYAIEAQAYTESVIAGNYFEDNYVGVYANGGAESSAFPKVINTNLTANTFTCTGGCDLLDKFDGQTPFPSTYYAGVLAKSAMIDVGNRDILTGLRNKFDRINNGIIAENSFVKVLSNDFSNLLHQTNNPNVINRTAIYGTGNFTFFGEIYDNTINNAHTGILGEAGAIFWNTHLNYMTDIDNGIIMENFAIPFDIIDNDITYHRTGIGYFNSNNSAQFWFEYNNLYDSGTFGNSKGIHLQNVRGKDPKNSMLINNFIYPALDNYYAIWIESSDYLGVHANTIDVDYPQTGRYGGFGDIKLDDVDESVIKGNFMIHDLLHSEGIAATNSCENTYCCNSIENTFSGNPIAGSFGMNFSGICDATRVRHNTMTNLVEGLHCDPSTILGLQGFAHNSWENIGNCSTVGSCFGAKHDGSFQQIIDSRFFVQNCGTPIHPGKVFLGATPEVCSGNADWFQFVDVNFTQECRHDFLCGGNPPPGGDGGGGEEQGVVQGNVEITTSEIKGAKGIHVEMLNWELGRNLFEKLSKHDSLIGNFVSVDSFYSANIESSISGFYSVKTKIEEALSFSDTEKETRKLAQTEIKILLEAIKSKDLLLLETSNDEEYTNIWNQRVDLQLALSNKINELSTTVETFNSRKAQIIESAIQVNNSIDAHTMFEQNQKTVYKVYLETLVNGDFEVNSMQAAEVYPIASLCPLDGGKAVTLARVLYRMFDEEAIFDDDELCAGVENRSTFTQRANLQSNIEVFPNPTEDILNVKFNMIQERDNSATIELYDLTGKVLFSRNYTKLEQSTIQISLSDIPQGVVICKVTLGNGMIENKKIFVLR